MSAPDALERLRALCGGPRDGALLRMTLAQMHITRDEHDAAIAQLRHALEMDADYSAAWKLLGKTLSECGDNAAAINAYQSGLAAARRRGDKQAEKEMQVFLRRLEKAQP